MYYVIYFIEQGFIFKIGFQPQFFFKCVYLMKTFLCHKVVMFFYHVANGQVGSFVY